MTAKSSEVYPADAPWWQRMLGPASLSWQAIIFGGIFNFPQMVLTGGNLGARTVQPGEYPTIAMISAATVLVTFLYGYLGHLTVFRNRHIRPVSLTTFLLFYAIGGLLYSVGIQISDAVSGSPSDIPFALRAVSAMTGGIAWGIAVALILDGRSRFRTERDALIAELVEEKERSSRQRSAISEGQTRLPDDVSTNFDRHLQHIRSAAGSLQDSGQSPAGLRRLVQAVDSAADIGVRRSSHELWESSLRVAATPRIGETLRAAIASPRVWPGVMAVLVGVGVPTVAVRNFGLIWGLPATVLLAVVTWWWMRFVNQRPLSAWPTVALSFFGVAVAVSVFSIAPVPLTPQVPGEIGSILIGLLGGFILVSFIATLQRERRETLLSLRNGILDEEATQLAEARQVAALARRLHGPVQSTLRVCAAEIERAADRGDLSAVENAVNEAVRALEHATKEDGISLARLDEALVGLGAAWKGFMEITFDLRGGLADLTDHNDVLEVITNAVADAHHHGQATRVHVEGEREGNRITLRVTDNGSAEWVGAPGLGTQLLRNVASEHRLSVSPDGAVLEVVFEVSPQVAVLPNPTIEK